MKRMYLKRLFDHWSNSLFFDHRFDIAKQPSGAHELVVSFCMMIFSQVYCEVRTIIHKSMGRQREPLWPFPSVACYFTRSPEVALQVQSSKCVYLIGRQGMRAMACKSSNRVSLEEQWYGIQTSIWTDVFGPDRFVTVVWVSCRVFHLVYISAIPMTTNSI